MRFAAGLTPLPTAARVTAARSALRWRIVSTLVSGLIFGLIVYFLGRDWSATWTWVFIGLWVATSVFWLVISIVSLRNAKRDLGRISEGVAFYLDAEGVEFVTPAAPKVAWGDVSALKLVGHSAGAGPRIALMSNDALVAQVPVSFIDAAPEIVDSMVRAYSLGRVSLDVTALDKVL